MTKQVYLGATLGNRGARLLNEEYQKAITGAGGTAYLAQNNKDISACQKQIEELHQLIDEKKIQNKKLQAISVAIDDL